MTYLTNVALRICTTQLASRILTLRCSHEWVGMCCNTFCVFYCWYHLLIFDVGLCCNTFCEFYCWYHFLIFDLFNRYGRYRPPQSLLSMKLQGWQKNLWHYAQNSILADLRQKSRTSSRNLAKRMWVLLSWLFLIFHIYNHFLPINNFWCITSVQTMQMCCQGLTYNYVKCLGSYISIGKEGNLGGFLSP